MTMFEQKGVNAQTACKSAEECRCEYAISCYACMHSSRCLWHDCSSCPVQLAHICKLAEFGEKFVDRVQKKRSCSPAYKRQAVSFR